MQFDFGQNWIEFSKQALTPEKVEQARRDFSYLFSGIDLGGTTFLDIGFGQGLGLIAAQKAGARVFGSDINPKCREALALSASVLNISLDIPVVIGSILDPVVVSRIAGLIAPHGTFSIVHSWGVLHHTGNMKKAIENAASLVDAGGYFVLAIYNRHWTSPVWRFVKWLYCASPHAVRAALIRLFFPIIAAAKFCVTGKNPFRKNRGMDFRYDVIDWIGGYPYEYASRKELESLLAPLGFRCIKFEPAEVPTGCNEFVFVKNGALS
jgi:2-polyprenyl-6-hydroxyphenyl methylase/3-demethylubiquinone-9 3-methyltransferase